MRNKLFLAAVAVSLVMLASAVMARPAKRLDPATQTCRIFTPATIEEGRELFKSVCKSCHSRNNSVDAPFLHSESIISRGWNRVFETRYPACAQNNSWGSLNDEQLRRVNDFLYMNSADAYDPQSGKDCG